MSSTYQEIVNPSGFINTPGITVGELIGKKIVLLLFWTFGCGNCRNTLPYINDWYAKYKDQGLEIVGVHTPEFPHEADYNNVVKATQQLGVKFPVVLDNDYGTWGAYRNSYWPRHYLINTEGVIVADHAGEGAYAETEAKIQELLSTLKK